ncbi:prolyl oligopeptidase family serine peptidase [Dehalococcoidia bacterium]|nr:prolyl oligopeptidase family serine peptidase [Dehalococcoidia bacterium]
MKRFIAGSILISVALCVVLSATHSGRVFWKTALMLPEIIQEVPIRPLLSLSDAPIIERVTYLEGSQVRSATLLRPNQVGDFGAMIFTLGVDANFQDPDVIRVTEAIARSGIVLLLPDSNDFVEVRVGPEEVDLLVDAFNYLSEQEYVDPNRIGFVGFSVGGSMAILAAADSRLRDRVAFVNAFGAYHDIFEMLSAVITNELHNDGSIVDWRPEMRAKDIFMRGALNVLSDPEDKPILSFFLQSPEMFQLADAEGLSEEGSAILLLLQAKNRAEFDMARSNLPNQLRQRLNAISPSQHIDNLNTKVFLMHDTGDRMIPFIESRRMFTALDQTVRVQYSEFTIFEHVNSSGVQISFAFARDMMKLFVHVQRLMSEVT